MTTRKGRLSEELDEEHIIELETQNLQETEQESVEREEIDLINDVGFMDESSDDDYIDPTLDIFVTSNNLNEGLSTNRSGFVRLLTKAADLLKFSIFSQFGTIRYNRIRFVWMYQQPHSTVSRIQIYLY